MNDTLFIITRIVVTVISAMVALFIMPYIARVAQNERYRTIMAMVETAVLAVEQTIRESGQGKAKKAEAMRLVSEWITDRGMQIDAEQLSALVEAAVYGLNHGGEFILEEV